MSNRIPKRAAPTGAWLLGAVCLLIAGGQGLAALPQSGTELRDVPVWPDPPAAPRIAYVTSYGGPAEFGIRPSFWRRVSGWLIGRRTDHVDFDRPVGVDIDDSGSWYIADAGAGAVVVYDRRRGRIERWEELGRVVLQSPVAVAASRGLVAVADSALGKVFVVNQWGRHQFTIDDEVQRPVGVALTEDALLVADAAAHAVLVFDRGGNLERRIGKRGTGDGELNYPTHVSVNLNGEILVTDSMNFRVQVFAASGTYLRTIGSVGDSSGHFSRPKGVDADTDGNAYVVDALFDNVQVFSADGDFLLHWGSAGAGHGEFWLPSGIAIGKDNTILIADSYNRRIQVFRYLGQP